MRLAWWSAPRWQVRNGLCSGPPPRACFPLRPEEWQLIRDYPIFAPSNGRWRARALLSHPASTIDSYARTVLLLQRDERLPPGAQRDPRDGPSAAPSLVLA